LPHSYYLSRHCAVCDELTHESKPLCPRCLGNPQLAAAVLAARWNRLERQYAQLARICLHCGGGGGGNASEGEGGLGWVAVGICQSNALRDFLGCQHPPLSIWPLKAAGTSKAVDACFKPFRLMPLPLLTRTSPPFPPCLPGGIVCNSLDCGVYFERRKVWFELCASRGLAEAGLSILDSC
jgi:hypothetical protein